LTSNEKYFICKLLIVESEGLKEKQRSKVLDAFKDGKINFDNLQVCLDRIQEIRSSNHF